MARAARATKITQLDSVPPSKVALDEADRLIIEVLQRDGRRPYGSIATEVGLGVRPSNDYLYVLIASPVGAYFKGGIQPVSVWLSTEYVRASPGGTGEAKCGGNYAASLIAQAQAAREGCDQVVWLDAIEHRWDAHDPAATSVSLAQQFNIGDIQFGRIGKGINSCHRSAYGIATREVESRAGRRRHTHAVDVHHLVAGEPIGIGTDAGRTMAVAVEKFCG